MLLAPWFAIAGLAAAAGPVVIHLLNRRRFRVVHWAAMDFLREAVQHSRRMLRFRNVLLMLLRTLAILAFGLAMARPFFSRAITLSSVDQPVHGIVLLDNSLSMSYQELDRTLLDTAKQQAKQWIERLPAGSRIAVIPLCGSAQGMSLNAYPTKEDALEAVAAIEAVDRATTAAQALDLAMEACRRVPDMPAKKIVLIGDGQVTGQSAEALAPQLGRLPAPVETIPVNAQEPENAWIADFKLQDDVADLQTPAVFLATVRYEGSRPRPSVQVTLRLDGVSVATATVDLLPGQAREIRFPPYRFAVPTEPGRPTYVTAEVSMTHDRLPADDQRFLVVPVVAALPVVFVDQYGPSEDPRHGRYGETYALRRLLAPITSRDEQSRQLIQVRHTTIDRVDRALLEDARLVVIAGVANPGPAVVPLRQYVLQGGQLVIAAGGDFDPSAWNDTAWLDGQGILPAPLRPQFAGRLIDDASGPPQTFQLDFNSLVHDYFLLEQVSREELEDLYRLPYFFKAAVPDLAPETVASMLRGAARQIDAERSRLAEIDRQLLQPGGGEGEKGVRSNLPVGPEGASHKLDLTPFSRSGLEQERRAIRPNWLFWGLPEPPESSPPAKAEELAERGRPQVLAALSNGMAYLVQRRIGQGRVLLVSGGFSTNWSSIALTNTMLVFDRIFRDMLRQTFPQRNMTTDGQFLLPITAAERAGRMELAGAGRAAPLAVDALGPDRYGVTVRNVLHRGGYRIVGLGNQDPAHAGRETKLWEVPLAVNGPADESRLVGPRRAGPPGTNVLATQQNLEGATLGGVAGQDTWRWLMATVLGCLLVELLVLALPHLKKAAAV
jgi:hypothetical protein